jgi:hypothetical protein
MFRSNWKLPFGVLYPFTCNFGWCFLSSSLQMFTYTASFDPTGHVHAHNLVCSSFKVTATAAGSVLDRYCAAVHMFRIYGFRWPNFPSWSGARQVSVLCTSSVQQMNEQVSKTVINPNSFRMFTASQTWFASVPLDKRRNIIICCRAHLCMIQLTNLADIRHAKRQQYFFDCVIIHRLITKSQLPTGTLYLCGTNYA